jgi:hypothetical protein
MWLRFAACVHLAPTAPTPDDDTVAHCRAAFPGPPLPGWSPGDCSAAVTDERPAPHPLFAAPDPPDAPGARAPASSSEVALVCAPEGWLSRDAAACVARAAGLPEGRVPWEVTLRLAPELNTVTWHVVAWVAARPDGRSETGQVLVLDAVDGTVRGRFGAQRTADFGAP